MQSNRLAVLYSFRRCPYAIRARLAIKASCLQVELREVVLANKPNQMLSISPKGTVPVLQLSDGRVIEESRDIIDWALQQNDPNGWLPKETLEIKETDRLIYLNDNEFKQQLDHYKYADRFPEHSMEYFRNQAELFLKHLEDILSQHSFLISDKVSMADIAIFPFIRQFAFVDKSWFDQTDYKNLQVWLNTFLTMDLFNDVMKKYPAWNSGDEVIRF